MPGKVIQIVIVSGKGGTGKTTLAAALSVLAEKPVAADCDVDAADLAILLKPDFQKSRPYPGGKKAAIDPAKCTECGLCVECCRFDAIHRFTVDSIACEGCGFCVKVCPEHAIEFRENISGEYLEGRSNGCPFFWAELYPGEGNSGKLVSTVKKQAEQAIAGSATEWFFVDGPPGIGCPVNASLTGADLVLAVTEPTVSGLHDLQRLVELTRRFGIAAGIVINKFDLNPAWTAKIENYAAEIGLPLLGKIAFDETVVQSLNEERIITGYPESTARREIENIWQRVRGFFESS